MTSSPDILAKIERLKNGATPRVLDLFAGCGGFSLGFQSTGFDIKAGVEMDAAASCTYYRNFLPGELPKARDITITEPETVAAEAGSPDAAAAFDVIVGGPPCQAFSRIGRAKLRDIAGHPEAFKVDSRANLYLRFLHYVRSLKPLAVVIENVPDIMNFDGRNVAAEICESLEFEGYKCAYTLLNAAHYGVPQLRERMFLLAYAQELEVVPTFPEPNRWIELPKGYLQIRKAYSIEQGDLFEPDPWFVTPPAPRESLQSAVPAAEAIGDLPPVIQHLDERVGSGSALSFVSNDSGYARTMREWPRFEASSAPSTHKTRKLPRDYPIFARMQPGHRYPDAHAIAEDLLRQEAVKQGIAPEEDPERYQLLKSRIVPPYPPASFPDRWRKLDPLKPSHTLTAHMGKDTYSHIHYDSAQARTITPREAARLQSFPDGFKLPDAIGPAMKQIGNSVPPLVAAALGRHILGQIRPKTE